MTQSTSTEAGDHFGLGHTGDAFNGPSNEPSHLIHTSYIIACIVTSLGLGLKMGFNYMTKYCIGMDPLSLKNGLLLYDKVLLEI